MYVSEDYGPNPKPHAGFRYHVERRALTWVGKAAGSAVNMLRTVGIAVEVLTTKFARTRVLWTMTFLFWIIFLTCVVGLDGADSGSCGPTSLVVAPTERLYPLQGYFRWTPHPAIVTIRDNRDYIRVLLYSYYTTITGWGGSS